LAQSNSSLRSQKLFDISSLGQPELSFWHRRDLAAGDGLFVEVSTDGASWTEVWSYAYCASGNADVTAPDSNGSPADCTQFNRQLGWERVSVPMGAHTGAPFYLRFRVQADGDGNQGDGAWIEDIRLGNYTETPYTIQPTRFFDDMTDSANWYLGGTWNTSTDNPYAGASAITDSPGGSYTHDTWSVLELRQPIDLAGITADQQPILTWWDRYALEEGDYARVQVSRWNGGAWSNWNAWQELAQHYFDTNTAWNRHMLDLSEYAGEKIRLRFVLDALQTSDVADGWTIDNVSVELYNPTTHSLPFIEDADNLVGWLPGGTWGTSLGQGTGTGGLDADPPGSWTATFYDFTTCPGTDAADRATAAINGTCGTPYAGNPVTLDEVQFACAATQSPDPSGTCVADASAWQTDNFAARFVRSFTVPATAQHSFNVSHNDGARLYVYPASGSISDSLVPEVFNDAHWITTAIDPVTFTVDMPIDAGEYIIELWYFEDTGNASITLDISRPSMAFYARSEGAYDDMLLTLDGLIDLTGAANPTLSWYEQYNLTNNTSCVEIEVALPYYRADEWATVYGPVCGTASDTAWEPAQSVTLLADLQGLEDAEHGTLTLSGEDALMALRFRLYADAAGNEWWVEDIRIDP
ncbi:MAG: hypothetical protein JXN59_10005, partial [Anaerolineae bacterium]|nr:hypothetical protein [Anaerolineae bacterium]